MDLTRTNFISILHEHVPNLDLDPAWVEQQLGYPLINDLARYICQRAELGAPAEIDSALRFLDLCSQSGDSYLRDLVIECLETLLACDSIAEISARFPLSVLAIWNQNFRALYEKRILGGANRAG